MLFIVVIVQSVGAEPFGWHTSPVACSLKIHPPLQEWTEFAIPLSAFNGRWLLDTELWSSVGARPHYHRDGNLVCFAFYLDVPVICLSLGVAIITQSVMCCQTIMRWLGVDAPIRITVFDHDYGELRWSEESYAWDCLHTFFKFCLCSWNGMYWCHRTCRTRWRSRRHRARHGQWCCILGTDCYPMILTFAWLCQQGHSIFEIIFYMHKQSVAPVAVQATTGSTVAFSLCINEWMRMDAHRPRCASWRRECRRSSTLLGTRRRSVVCVTLACSREWIVHCVGCAAQMIIWQLHHTGIDQMKAKFPADCMAIVHPNTEASSTSMLRTLLGPSRLCSAWFCSWCVWIVCFARLFALALQAFASIIGLLPFGVVSLRKNTIRQLVTRTAVSCRCVAQPWCKCRLRWGQQRGLDHWLPLQFTKCEAEGVLKSDAQMKEEADHKAKEEMNITPKKKKITIYLSFTNVPADNSFCEVKLRVWSFALWISFASW